MELQIKNINEGFGELIRKLEEKKQDIIVGFQRKYKKEEQRLMNKMNQINSSQTEVGSITKIFEELVSFTEVNNDAQIL